MTDTPPYFLETFDSVSSATDPLDPNGGMTAGQQRQIALAQTDAAIALAFGHDIVVPHTYAFDSIACQSVVGAIADAASTIREQDTPLSPGSAPVRVYLHQVQGRQPQTFGEAAAMMVEATAAGEFLSSAFPDIIGLDNLGRHVDALKNNDSRAFDWLDDVRAAIFASSWQYLRTRDDRDTSRLHTGSSEYQLRLPTLAQAVLGGSDDSTVMRDVRHGLDRLRVACTMDEPFGGRSALRSDAPWAADGQTARDVVGSDATYDLIVEIIDDLYNQVLASSLGRLPVALSTTPSTDARHAADLALAQTSAVRAGSNGTFFAPAVGYVIQAEEPVRGWPINPHVELFAAILRQRETSDWRDSLQAVRRTREDVGNYPGFPSFRRDFTKAMDDHFELIAQRTDGLMSVTAEGNLSLLRMPSAAGPVLDAGAVFSFSTDRPLLGTTFKALKHLASWRKKSEGRASREQISVSIRQSVRHVGSEGGA